MSSIRFVFVGEGSSDAGLVPHLEQLCIYQGASEVTGIALDPAVLGDRYGRTVAEKLRARRIGTEREPHLHTSRRGQPRSVAKARGGRGSVRRPAASSGLGSDRAGSGDGGLAPAGRGGNSPRGWQT